MYKSERKIVIPSVEEKQLPSVSVLDSRDEVLSVSFVHFVFNSVCIKNEFNNNFKDDGHFRVVLTDFMQNILPKITSHKFSELCQGSPESDVLHFHTVDEKHREIVRKVMKELNFNEYKIEQIFEGNKLFEFSACLGHIYPARIICYKVGNILYLLFLDTNHHIYFSKRRSRETLFYEECPKYIDQCCNYMPTDCFAVEYLDEEKILNSLGFQS